MEYEFSGCGENRFLKYSIGFFQRALNTADLLKYIRFKKALFIMFFKNGNFLI